MKYIKSVICKYMLGCVQIYTHIHISHPNTYTHARMHMHKLILFLYAAFIELFSFIIFEVCQIVSMYSCRICSRNDNYVKSAIITCDENNIIMESYDLISESWYLNMNPKFAFYVHIYNSTFYHQHFFAR